MLVAAPKRLWATSPEGVSESALLSDVRSPARDLQSPIEVGRVAGGDMRSFSQQCRARAQAFRWVCSTQNAWRGFT